MKPQAYAFIVIFNAAFIATVLTFSFDSTGHPLLAVLAACAWAVAIGVWVLPKL